MHDNTILSRAREILCYLVLARVPTEDPEHGSTMHRANLQDCTAVPSTPVCVACVHGMQTEFAIVRLTSQVKSAELRALNFSKLVFGFCMSALQCRRAPCANSARHVQTTSTLHSPD
jgi:hypothetical protein